jgi:hypothetical protein
VINHWRDIRDQALRPIYPVKVIEEYLIEQAMFMEMERIADRAYLKDRIEQEFS